MGTRAHHATPFHERVPGTFQDVLVRAQVHIMGRSVLGLVALWWSQPRTWGILLLPLIAVGVCLPVMVLSFDPNLVPGCGFQGPEEEGKMDPPDLSRTFRVLVAVSRRVRAAFAAPVVSVSFSGHAFLFIVLLGNVFAFSFFDCEARTLNVLLGVVALSSMGGIHFKEWFAAALLVRGLLPLAVEWYGMGSACHWWRAFDNSVTILGFFEVMNLLSVYVCCRQLLLLMTCINEQLDVWVPVMSDVRRPLHSAFAALSELEAVMATSTAAGSDDMKLLHDCSSILETVTKSGSAPSADVAADLDDLVSRFGSLLRSSQRHDVTVTTSEVQVGSVLVAESAIVQSLTNLISNAHKYTPSGGQLSLTVNVLWHSVETKTGGLLEFVLADTGPGVPEDMREAIFDSLLQVDGSQFGAGIGLGVVRQLCEEHHGSYECGARLDSQPGARFVVRFPFSTERASVFAHKRASTMRLRGAALAVDDSPTNLAVVARFLARMGADPVYRCSSGAEVLDLLASGATVSYAVVDLVLGGDMDGADVVEVLQRRGKVAIVGVSASIDVAERRFRAANIPVLSKPFNFDDLTGAFVVRPDNNSPFTILKPESRSTVSWTITSKVYKFVTWAALLTSLFRWASVTLLHGFSIFETVLVFSHFIVYLLKSPTVLNRHMFVFCCTIFPLFAMYSWRGCSGSTGLAVPVAASQFLFDEITGMVWLGFSVVATSISAYYFAYDHCPTAGPETSFLADVSTFVMIGAVFHFAVTFIHKQFDDRQSLLSTLRYVFLIPSRCGYAWYLHSLHLATTFALRCTESWPRPKRCRIANTMSRSLI
jgi:CheY-like chemotaxis protein